jgi:hypothetical protein
MPVAGQPSLSLSNRSRPMTSLCMNSWCLPFVVWPNHACEILLLERAETVSPQASTLLCMECIW